MDSKHLDVALETISLEIRSWLEHSKKERDDEGLSTDGSTHIMRVPAWPSHDQLEHWIQAIDLARERLNKQAHHGEEAKVPKL